MGYFPSLAGFEPTRKTLHLYSNALSIIPRAHLVAHPKWWHISLVVRPEGLFTDNVPLPDGGILTLHMDLRQHKIVLETSHQDIREWSMTAGLTSTQVGEQIITAVGEFGLQADYARDKFKDDSPRDYDPVQAETFFKTLVKVDTLFKAHMAGLSGMTGPVQFWPHGFDLSAEWFGTRVVTAEEHGEVQEFPAQLNLGFYPGNEDIAPYFYSNPFPFEADTLLDIPLPAGAKWYTESWQGSLLPYSELVDDAQADERLLAYAKAVFAAAAPTLKA